MTLQQAEQYVDLEPQYEIIQDRQQILHILRDLMHERALMTALLEGGKSVFSTAIFDIQPENDIFILDELIPRQGNEIIQLSEKIWLLGQIRGIKTALQTEIIDSGIEVGIYYHHANFPEKIRHQQRRSSYRATVSYGMKSFVRIVADQDKAIRGQLRDLSIGGLSVILPLLISIEELSVGTVLENCEVELPGEGQLEARAEVRHVRREGGRRSARVGLAFVDIAPQIQRQIQRSVTFLEREQLRK